MLACRMLREGMPIGRDHVRRTEARPSRSKQIALLETFADQAVIAIENVRLFTELEARNRELTEALEQQTATGEILRGDQSRRPRTFSLCFDTLVESAARLCGDDGTSSRLDGECSCRAEYGTTARPRHTGF